MQPRLNTIFLGALVLSAAYFFYSALTGRDNFFTRHVHIQKKQAVDKIGITELNYLIPEFKELLNFAKGEMVREAVDWNKLTVYFEKIAELMPQRYDVYLFLGYCYFYQGKKDQAWQSFNKAVALNDQSFWGYYNMGILAMQQGNAQAASGLMAQAMKIPPQQTAQEMLASKLYLDIFRAEVHFDQMLGQDLAKAYVTAASLNERPVQGLAHGVQIQIF